MLNNYEKLPNNIVNSEIVHKYIPCKDEVSYNYPDGSCAYIDIRKGILYIYNKDNIMVETRELKDKNDLEFLKNAKKDYRDLEKNLVVCSIF